MSSTRIAWRTRARLAQHLAGAGCGAAAVLVLFVLLFRPAARRESELYRALAGARMTTRE